MWYFISELIYCPSVGECIISHTNHHTIGSEPKLKEGAETEVARLQFQMGKWQKLKVISFHIWPCLTHCRKDWAQREKPRSANAEDHECKVRGQCLPIPQWQCQWRAEMPRTLSRTAKVYLGCDQIIKIKKTVSAVWHMSGSQKRPSKTIARLSVWTTWNKRSWCLRRSTE